MSGACRTCEWNSRRAETRDLDEHLVQLDTDRSGRRSDSRNVEQEARDQALIQVNPPETVEYLQFWSGNSDMVARQGLDLLDDNSVSEDPDGEG